MNADLLLAHFYRINDVPDAVPRLRRFILDLAVRGKLGTQVPTERVRVSVPEVRPSTETHEAPDNWRWTVFGEIANIAGGYAFKSGDYSPSGIFILRVTNIEPSGTITRSDSVFLPKEKVTAQIEHFYLNEGDILLVMVGGSLGKTGVVPADILPALLNQNLWRITPKCPEVDVRYLKLLTDFVVSFQRRIQHSTHGHLSREDFRMQPIALPPISEQHRIVAKVADLMALCDQLEAAQREREHRRDRLTAATHHYLNNGEDAESLRGHAQFFFNHLPCLTSRPDQIKQLRQTILNLAVRGKLVPQDNTEEPALKLLERIRHDSLLLRKSKTIGAQFQVSDEHQPFPIPPNWVWTRLGFLAMDADSGWSPKTEGFPRDGKNWGVLKVSAVSWDRFLPEENKQLLPGVTPRETAQVHQGDFLISRANTSELVAKCVLVEEEPENLMMSDKIVRLQIAKPCNKRFVSFVNNHAAYARMYYATEASGTSLSMKNVSREVIYRLLIPLPPLAEQHRIVTKVYELMAVCDQLEAQLTTAQTEAGHLLESVLHNSLNVHLSSEEAM